MKTPRVPGLVFVSLLLHPLAALAVTDTWDGGSAVDDLISRNDNWVDSSAPVSNLASTDLIFAGVVRPTPNVGTAFSARSIVFDNTADAFVIGGLQLNVGTAGITNNDTQTMTFSNLVSFSGVANTTINAASGGLNFNNTVTLPTGTLTVNGASPTSFVNISGTSANALSKLGAGTMTWTPNIPTAFDMTIDSGTLTLGVDGAVDVFSSASTIAVNGTSAFMLGEGMTLDGAQLTRASGAAVTLGSGKVLTVQNGGDAILTGAYTGGSLGAGLTVTGAGSAFSTTSSLSFDNGDSVNVAAGGSLSSGAGSVLLDPSMVSSTVVTVTDSGSIFSGGPLTVRARCTLTFSNASTGAFAGIIVSNSTFFGLPVTGRILLESGATVTGTGLTTTGSVNVTGAGSTLTLSGAAVASFGVGTTGGFLGVASGGTFHSGTGLTTVNDGSIAITGGTFNANGDLTVNSDAQLTRDAAGVFTLGAARTLTLEAGGDATFTGFYENATASTIVVTGADSTFSTTTGLGIQGGSTLDVSAGGDVTSNGSGIFIGTSGDGTATVDGAGSTFGGANVMVAGGSTATGTLSFSNGSAGTFTGINVVTSAETGATGTLDIQSDADVTGTLLRVGDAFGNNTGTVTITGTGSTLTLSSASSSTIGSGSGGIAALNVQTSGTFNSGTGLTTVNATGLIAITGGTFNANGDLTLNGGQLTRDTTGVFALDAARTLTVQAGGDAAFGSYSNSTASSIVVTGAGSTLATAGTLSLQSGTTLNVAAGGSVSSGTGSVSMGTSGNATVTVTSPGSTFSGGNLTVGGNGATASLTFSNKGGGVFRDLNVDVSGIAGTNGSLNIQGGATVTGEDLLLGTAAIANTGSVTITGESSALTLSGASTATIGAASSSTATLTVESGGTFTTGTGATNIRATGTINVNNGGTLRGAADFTGVGPINIAGSYRPGTVSGVNRTTSVSFAQNMTFQPTTSITLELGGAVAGTEHDQILFQGPGATQVTWNGLLNVLLINGFTPAAGQSFNLVDFDNARDAGAFSAINLPALPAGLFWRADQFYLDGTVRVSLTPNTYAEWQSAVGSGAFDADDDHDGIPNGVEFLLGTNPNVPFGAGEFPLTELPQVNTATMTQALVTFQIPVDPASDARYRVSASSDFVNWTTIASKDGAGPWTGTAMVGIDPAVAGLTRVTVTEALPLGATPRFHRLEAALP